ncbi:hypothetical protein KQ308_03985 [Synechococcus sp. CS-1327]|nr:hypothetical protein [Synechococcus sp. CS-1327]
MAEQAGISKRTLERLETGAVSTQLSLFLRMLQHQQKSEWQQTRQPALALTRLILAGRQSLVFAPINAW